MSRAALLAAAVAASTALHVAVAGFLPPTQAARTAGGAAGTPAIDGVAFEDLAAGGVPRQPSAPAATRAPAPPSQKEPIPPRAGVAGPRREPPAPATPAEGQRDRIAGPAPRAQGGGDAGRLRTPVAPTSPRAPAMASLRGPAPVAQTPPAVAPRQVPGTAAQTGVARRRDGSDPPATGRGTGHGQRPASDAPRVHEAAPAGPEAAPPAVREPAPFEQLRPVAPEAGETAALPQPSASEAGGAARDEAGVAPRVAGRPRPRPETAPAGRAEAPGNAEREARRGGAHPSPASDSSDRAAATPAARAGSADLTNWRGAVLRQIQRQPRPRVGGSGTAHVSFTVLPSGAVGSVRLSRSSGSRRIDTVALAHIRRTGPFAPPPGGAAVALTVAFEGRD